MGMVKRRVVYEQPVSLLNLISSLLVTAALCALLGGLQGAASQGSTRSSQPLQQQQQDDAGVLQQHLHHHRPLCPDGWVPGSMADRAFKDKDADLCLYLSAQALTWTQARATCRSMDSFLLTLDSVLSVDDKLFNQYLKEKGVSDVWTGMHKSGGRQIWDEPGKGIVVPYRGVQTLLGVAKRGWSWNVAAFSDATNTCGIYGYSPDTGAADRRRRDADTPSPAAVPPATSSDRPGKGREDTARVDAKGTGDHMDAFKSFLSDQGMKRFADRLDDSPTVRGAKDAVPPGLNKDGSTIGPRALGSTDTAKDHPAVISPPDTSTRAPTEKEKDHPSDDTNSGTDKPSNSTNDPASSDEEDTNHEVIKRSTPTMNAAEATTDNPGSLSNATMGNVTTPAPTLTDNSNSTSDNSTSSASQDSSPKNDTASSLSSNGGDVFGESGGFSQELLEFFKTDSSEPSNTGTAQGTPSAQTNAPSSVNSSQQIAPPTETETPSRLSAQHFIHRFHTGDAEQLSGSQAASPGGAATDTVQSESTTGARTAARTQSLSTKTANSLTSVNEDTLSGGTDGATSPTAGSDQRFFNNDPVTTTTVATEMMQRNQARQTAGIAGDDIMRFFGDAALPKTKNSSSSTATITPPPSGTPTTTPLSPASTTTDGSSSEEDTTDSSSELTTPTLKTSSTSVTNGTNSGPTNTSAFETHFGASRSDSTQLPSMFPIKELAGAEHKSSEEKSKEHRAAEGASTDTRSESAESSTPATDSGTEKSSSEQNSVETLPSSTGGPALPTTAADSREVTDSGEVFPPTTTPAVDSSEESTMDSREVDTTTTTATRPTTHATPTSTSSGGDSSEERTTPTGRTPVAFTKSSEEIFPQITSDESSSEEVLSSLTGGRTSDRPQGSTATTQGRNVLDVGAITQRPDPMALTPGHSWVSLHQCREQHQFVCAAKPVHNFRYGAQCDEGWMGHSLLSRCYRLVTPPATQTAARDNCRTQGGTLAAADTIFFTNVTHMLLDRMALLRGFASQIWIETGQGSEDGQCSVMEAQVSQLTRLPCDDRLAYICQKPAKVSTSDSRPSQGDDDDDDDDDDNKDILEQSPMMLNMSSRNTQPLVCPLMTMRHDDVVIWYKDGKPIPSDNDDTSTVHSTNTRTPRILQLNVRLLQRLGVTPQRMQQAAMLQGVYWCRVWRLHPLQSITSRPLYVRFQDVITLQGFIKTSDLTPPEAVFFNQMADPSGLPSAIGQDLQQMNDRIYSGLHQSQFFLSDVLTIIQRADPDTDEIEFRTYLCLSTEAMAPQDKGAVVDGYLKALHTELVASEESVRRDWNLSLPFEQAFRLLMTEMCPESRLKDEARGHEATFPSTPVNQHAVSIDSCDGLFTGYALCSGDLRSGAHWSYWEVETSCEHGDQAVDASDSDDEDDGLLDGVKIDPEDIVDTGDGFLVPGKPNPGLLDIDEVHIEPENVADVTDRLADILDTSVDLTDVDVEIVADVIDRVSLVPILPQDVGLTLLKTVNRVLDSPLPVLQQAQRRTQASTRILHDLDKFSEKLDFGRKGHVRYVTDNIAMEVWNTRTAREPVIGLAATLGAHEDSPLSEARILTLSNRTWADMHLADFDVAIELPDQLVSADSIGSGRLSMAIYRRPGLFLSSLPIKDDSSPVELNSAIISATLASRSVTNLQDKVKLIFRPLRRADDKVTRCVFWDFNLPDGGGWSSRGCVYNGTSKGRDICMCDHLTNFAVLLDFYGDARPWNEANTTALSIITIIGLSLSILGLALTVITFIFFKKLRQGRAQQTLFHMSVALLCSEVTLLTGLKATSHYGVCLAVAALLHYFILASFLWMLVEAVLQYLTFVKVLGTYVSKYTLKTVLPAWSIPLIPVIAILATDYRMYRGRIDYCWMNLDAFYYAFALPVGIIILFNLVTFVVIMISLLRRPEGLRSTRNKSNTTETNVKAAFTIFILLGLTWTFGYLAIADARLPFQYMFTVFSSLQGFLIFVLLVARRRQFREQWRALCCGRLVPVRGQKVTPTLSNSASSQSSTGSFTSSSRSRSSSGGSTKTLQHSLIKRADSTASTRSKVQPQLSAKGSVNGQPC